MRQAVQGPTPLFIEGYLYAVNKAAYKVLGKSAMALARSVADSIWNHLVARGLIPSEPTFDDIKRLFVEHFKLASDVRVVEEEGGVTLVLEGLTISGFLETAAKDGFEPVLCPLSAVLTKACENMKGGKLAIRRYEIVDPSTVKIHCAYV
ncbi:MAG: hypothetical protein ABWK01_09965 [Infirmifilum sp.]